MNRDLYTIALTNALTEIKKAYPDIHHSLLFTTDSTVIARDKEADEKTMNSILDSFQSMNENAKAIGNLKSFQINGKNGKLTLTSIEDMYLVLATSKKADKTLIHSITNVIIPTILKTLETFSPTHLQPSSPQKELIVDTLSGFFKGDSVQIDTEILTSWNQNDNPRARVSAAITGEQTMHEPIDHVKIEALNGNSILCKVKEIDDQKLKGKNMIRIPEKLCKSLEINKGDTVKVKPL